MIGVITIVEIMTVATTIVEIMTGAITIGIMTGGITAVITIGGITVETINVGYGFLVIGNAGS
jgi:hypothetical protein